MWLDNLLELKKEKNLSTKQLAEKSNLPEKTVSRILTGHTTHPYIDTLYQLATALDCSLGDILAGTKAVVGDTKLSELKENLDAITAERDMLLADKIILDNEIKALTSEIELLKMQIMFKDKIIATHECYINILNKKE